jgi:methyltransferase (TIGR00027 family)
MIETNSPVRNISDTARWDPYAERLAGDLGFHIANTLAEGNKHEWAWVARTYLFDKFLAAEIQKGADLVLNLAAGLDARPYRMDLPATLRWVEVDLPEIVSYKQEILADEKPRCQLQRISLDLSDVPARRKMFAELNQRAGRVVVLTEGLLIYFTPEEVASFARDLAAGARFQSWIIDLTSPGQLKLMQRTSGVQLTEAGAAFKFGPSEGPRFFAAHSWEPKEVEGLLKTAAHFKRSPKGLLPMHLDSLDGVPANFPWTGVCLLVKP